MSDNYWNKLMETVEVAGVYMETYGEGPGTALRHFIGSLINDDESVLDVGCGPGHNYQHFKLYGPSVTYKGKDYASLFIKACNSKFPEANFELGDVRDFKEADRSWDVVIMQDVLEHTNGYEKPLSEALRVARKRIIVTFWHLMDKEEDNPVNDDGDDGWGAWYSRPKWEKYLDSLNLHWLHDQIPRKGELHDIYVIDLEVEHGE